MIILTIGVPNSNGLAIDLINITLYIFLKT